MEKQENNVTSVGKFLQIAEISTYLYTHLFNRPSIRTIALHKEQQMKRNTEPASTTPSVFLPKRINLVYIIDALFLVSFALKSNRFICRKCLKIRGIRRSGRWTSTSTAKKCTKRIKRRTKGPLDLLTRKSSLCCPSILSIRYWIMCPIIWYNLLLEADICIPAASFLCVFLGKCGIYFYVNSYNYYVVK